MLKRGQSGYITRAVRGVPNKGTKSEVATSPLPSEDAQKTAKWLDSLCRLAGPQQGDKSKLATSPLPSQCDKKRAEWLHNPTRLGWGGGGQQGDKIKVATSRMPSSQGPQKRAEWLHHPYRPRSPQQGDKIKNGSITYAFSVFPKRGQNGYIALAVWGSPTRGQNHKCLHPPCLLGAPKRGRNGYITPPV